MLNNEDTQVEEKKEEAVFAAPGKFFKTRDVREALEISNSLRLTETSCKLGDISLTANMKISFKGEEKRMTSAGFFGFCKLLGLPKKFATSIPDDLLLDNVQRLISDNFSSNITIMSRPSGDIVNFIPEESQSFQSFDVLSAIASSFESNIKYIDINDSFMKICISYSDTVKISDKESLYISNFVTNYPAREGKFTLSANSGLFKTECENSFVMQILGKLKVKYHLDKELRLSKFLEHLGICDNIFLSIIKSRSSIISSSNLFDFELKNLWKAIQPILGPVIADKLLKIDNEETRKILFSSIDLRKIKNKQSRLTGDAVDDPVLLNVNTYDVLNEITLYAHTVLAGESRHKLETICGKFLSNIILN